jgi:hypothetical protein
MTQYVITLVVKFEADDDRSAHVMQSRIIDAAANATFGEFGVQSVNSPAVPARLP